MQILGAGHMMPSVAHAGRISAQSGLVLPHQKLLAALPGACARSSSPIISPAAQPQHFRSFSFAPTIKPSVLCRGTPGLMNLPLDKDLDEPLPGFDSIESALKDLAEGKFVVVLDDEDRENEGDLIMAADKVTTEAMAYMVEYTSGVICISMEGKDLDRLKLPLMISSAENEEAMYTAFTVTVDLRDGITTGISAEDRAKTIRHLANPAAQPSEFRRPGHIFPLRYRQGGVIVRPGHTEAGVDLARLAGCYPAGVLCEIVNKTDGSMSRTPELMKYAKEHGLKCITIADLIRYRLRHESLVKRKSSQEVESSRYGRLTVHTYESILDGSEHIAYVAGSAQSAQQHDAVPVYVHQESCVSDILQPSTSSNDLDAALTQVSSQGSGVVVYMRSRLNGEPSPSSEVQNLNAASSTQGMDIRVYGQAGQILKDLGVTNAVAISSDESQAKALRSCGINVQTKAANGASVNGAHAAAASGGVLAGVR